MQGTMKKVLTPIENEKTGKTHWPRCGTCFPNRDGSWNILLDVLPTNRKLHVRDFDDRDNRPGGKDTAAEELPF